MDIQPEASVDWRYSGTQRPEKHRRNGVERHRSLRRSDRQELHRLKRILRETPLV